MAVDSKKVAQLFLSPIRANLLCQLPDFSLERGLGSGGREGVTNCVTSTRMATTH